MGQGSDAPGPSGQGASAAESSTTVRETDKRDYLEQKYGSKESHTSLTKEQVEGMLDQVLQNNSTVLYLLESLKQVCIGCVNSTYIA